MSINRDEMTFLDTLEAESAFSVSQSPCDLIPLAFESLPLALPSFVGEQPDRCTPETLCHAAAMLPKCKNAPFLLVSDRTHR